MNFDKYIATCNECVKSCEECITSCLTIDASKMAGCIQACRDCSEICNLMVRLLSRNSKHKERVAIFCAIASDMCAKECNMYDDEDCKKCAKACKKCSIACSTISKI